MKIGPMESTRKPTSSLSRRARGESGFVICCKYDTVLADSAKLAPEAAWFPLGSVDHALAWHGMARQSFAHMRGGGPGGEGNGVTQPAAVDMCHGEEGERVCDRRCSA